jgi:hypothetical protein
MDDEIAAGNVSNAVHRDLFGNWSKKDIQLLGAAEMMDLWQHDPPLTDDARSRAARRPQLQEPLVEDLLKRALERVQAGLPKELSARARRRGPRVPAGNAQQHVSQLEARGSNARFPAPAASGAQHETKIIDQTSAAAGRPTASPRRQGAGWTPPRAASSSRTPTSSSPKT